jgi:hypothetical protein
MISRFLWNNRSKRARALSLILTIPKSKEITLGSIQYIAKHNELLQPIVFNFIEYLTSVFCINLHLGYHCTRLPPSSSLSCALPLYLDSDYFSVSVLDPQSSDLPHSLPENQGRAFSTLDSVSNQGPSHLTSYTFIDRLLALGMFKIHWVMSSFVIICQQPEDSVMFQNLPWDSMRFRGIPQGSIRFHEIS